MEIKHFCFCFPLNFPDEFMCMFSSDGSNYFGAAVRRFAKDSFAICCFDGFLYAEDLFVHITLSVFLSI